MLTATESPVKPRILIADDSRIVRATLIKQIEGMFEFREALDGEQAWETLLLDQSIRVVITDLTMPRLDGYGLLRRIRASRISRIREIPVVVVSGSDESEERERAKAAGANDLITKGIGTGQLLSRLDVLAKLVSSPSVPERGLEVVASRPPSDGSAPMMEAEAFHTEAEVLLQQAQRTRRNFVLLNVCVALHRPGRYDASNPPEAVMDVIGQLLQRTVRQSDFVGRTGEEQFTLAAGSIGAEAARTFGQRVAQAISRAQFVKDPAIAFIASCGLVSLSEQPGATLQALQELARVRARFGLDRGLTGVIGAAEEAALRHGDSLAAESACVDGEPGVATLLQWLKDGRHAEVTPHIDKLTDELRPLVDLLLQQVPR